MTLPEPKSPYTMTLSQVPEWRQSALNDREVQRHPESGDKCTQSVGISVPEESTYAPSIRTMISSTREFTAKAQSQRQPEQTKRSPKRRKSSRNTKQVNNQSESKKGQSKWKNETKQAKRQVKLKTSEVQRRSPPKDASINKITKRLPSYDGNRQSIWWSRRRSNEFSKRGRTPCPYDQVLPTSKQALLETVYRDTHWEVDREVYREVDQSSPTDKPKAHWDAIYWDAPRSRPRSLPRSRPVKSYRQAKSPPGCNLLRCTEKSTEKSTRSRP